jgi:hypothetical protein
MLRHISDIYLVCIMLNTTCEFYNVKTIVFKAHVKGADIEVFRCWRQGYGKDPCIKNQKINLHTRTTRPTLVVKSTQRA